SPPPIWFLAIAAPPPAKTSLTLKRLSTLASPRNGGGVRNSPRPRPAAALSLCLPRERVFPAAEVQADGHAHEAQFLAHQVHQIALVAVGQFFQAAAEHDERRRADARLRDVAQLDSLAPRRGRRVALQRGGEPVVEA